MARLYTLLLILFVAPLALLVDASAISAPLPFDDFESATLDTAKWTNHLGGYGPTINTGTGQIVIELPLASSELAGEDFFGVTLAASCSLLSDFDLQVDYELLTWPANNGVRVGVMVGADQASPRDYGVTRASFGNNDFDGQPREVYLYGAPGLVEGITETNHFSGSLRMVRAEGQITGYYLDGKEWRVLSARDSMQAPIYFGIGAWSHSYAFTNQNVRIAFDNVIINSGEIDCPNDEPQLTETLTPTATQTETPTPTATGTQEPTKEAPQASGFTAFLPSLENNPAPTETPTPTPTLTPEPTAEPTATATSAPVFQLEDGYYEDDLAGGGWIHFTVAGNGSRVTSAGFLVDYGGLCYTHAYSFEGDRPITNGKFSYVDHDGVSIHARFHCRATSTTSASCSAYRHTSNGLGACGSVSGTPVRQ